MARACCISARTAALSPASAFTLAFAFLFAMAPAQRLGAATVVTPYFQDFEGYADGASSTVFTENNGAAYVVLTDTGGDRAFRGRVATSSTPASAAVQVADAEGKDFTISSTLRLSELNVGTINHQPKPINRPRSSACGVAGE